MSCTPRPHRTAPPARRPLSSALVAVVALVIAGLASGCAGPSDGPREVGEGFAADVAENWQSEYLQFVLFIGATVWLVQRGSTVSGELDQVGPQSDERQHVRGHALPGSPRWAAASGWRLWLASHSLGLVMGAIFVASWAAQAVTGHVAHDEQQLLDLEAPTGLAGYVASADFWNRTLQNWQSEFLAVGSMVVLWIYLRERGSAESKPVGAAHDDTGVEG
ncbi:hypothetical protein IFT72_14875 [Frigoribacterium sp. CFBP 8754]|uniref:DUF6766 family protein n=1 Tax=Frigoribacterium sp. CFBP 8754 TaxID=2775290 RepID=UPI00178431AF|nr:DUF6766 family protein [Frigoribacterium sp. CFBP 8754]MBD8661470.1 hypothetical protein [Frigoribacterium sp. CFBP 8754]